MDLVFLALFIALLLVFLFYMAMGRVHIGVMILCVLFGIIGICLLFGISIKFILIALGVAIITGVIVGLVSWYGAEGITSLIWWVAKDNSPIQKDLTIKCNSCGTENMLGRFLCIKCAAKLPAPEPADRKNKQANNKKTAC